MRRTSSRLAAKRATETIAEQSRGRGAGAESEEKKAAAKRKRSTTTKGKASSRQKKGKVTDEEQQQQTPTMAQDQEMKEAPSAESTTATTAPDAQQTLKQGEAEPAEEKKGKEAAQEGEEEQPQQQGPEGKEEEEGVEEYPEEERHEMGLILKDLIPHESRGTDFLEKGLIYFFYRPRVGETEVKSLVDVNRLYVLLSPQQIIHPSNATKVHRLLLIGRKKLPEPSPRHRFWVLVEKTSENIADIHDFLGKETYDTQTMGER